MKFLITENQIERLVFRYLDNQGFIKIETDNVIYFSYSESDEFAQIAYWKIFKYGVNRKYSVSSHCFIHISLLVEVLDMFSLGYVESREIIGRWVENNLKIKLSGSSEVTYEDLSTLRIRTK